MTNIPTLEISPSAAANTTPGWRATLPVYMELGKWRLSTLVLLTTAVGYAMAGPGSIAWVRLGLALFGTALAALGANALNQLQEEGRDARMVRTRRRPLPTRRLSPGRARLFGLATGLGGPLLLAATVSPAAALLALSALLIYLLLYTPLKLRTPLNTLVGAVVGALPPMIGWAAATGGLAAGAWILAGILFLWQIPHFLSLAWLYREDYARGGFRMLPAVDPSGRLTGCMVVIYTLVLLPLTTMPALLRVTGWTYAVGSVLLGLGLLALGVALERHRTNAAARRVFLATIAYLPLLLGLMVVDRRPAPDAAPATPNVAQAAPAARARAALRGDA